MIDWPTAAKQASLYAAAANVVVLAVLLCTRRWWSLTRGDACAGTVVDDRGVAAWVAPCVEDARRRRAFWIGLGLILVLAAALRVPLARSSLWWDEVWQARNASVGEWRPDRKNPGKMRFRETTFAQAMWNYRKPANHPPMAVAGKACHEVWRKVTGAPPGAFNEFVLRLPGFAASLAGIALVALLLRAWGMPGGGLAAAFFLAMHPWHIRYGIDGRGYTFLVPLTLIGLWALWRACGPPGRASEPLSRDADTGAPAVAMDGRHRESPAAWWIFGISQALILWSHLLSVWVCLSLCVAGVWWIVRRHAGAERWRRLARLAAVQAAGAMLFLQLFLPNLLQATRWGEKNQDGRLLDGPVLLDTLTQVAVGSASVIPAFVVLILAMAGVALAVSLSRGHGPDDLGVSGVAGLVALLVGAAVFLVGVWATGFYFYPRFLFAVAAPLAAAIGIALELSQRLTRLRLPWLPSWWDQRAIIGFFCLGILLTGGLSPVLTRGFSPLRETADVLRAAEAEGAHVFGYGFGAEALQYYLPSLPYAREADAPEALAAAVETAHAAGRPLLVATGYEDLNRLALPAGFRRLDDPAQCAVAWSQSGLEPQFAYRIRLFRPPESPASP